MRIEVTAEHIKRGRPLASSSCPIALALSQAKGGGRWNVQKWAAWPIDPFLNPNGGFYDLPHQVRLFITAFDLNQPVKPFSFELPEPRWRFDSSGIY